MRYCAAIVQLARTRKVTERVDVSPDMPSESQGFGSRAASGRSDVLAVFLDEAEQIRWMHGVMRHPDEIRLCEIVGFCGLQLVEEIGSHVHREYLGRASRSEESQVVAVKSLID